MKMNSALEEKENHVFRTRFPFQPIGITEKSLPLRSGVVWRGTIYRNRGIQLRVRFPTRNHLLTTIANEMKKAGNVKELNKRQWQRCEEICDYECTKYGQSIPKECGLKLRCAREKFRRDSI
jgi:hypothetical protein